MTSTLGITLSTSYANKNPILIIMMIIVIINIGVRFVNVIRVLLFEKNNLESSGSE